jgi:hypothetical protein
MELQRWPVLGLSILAACSSSTGPNTPTPTPTPSVDIVDPSVPALLSFKASPATITQGQALTLDWQGQNGTVRLAIKGQDAFISGLPASGSLVLTVGLPGYPTGTGVVTYQAAIADVGTRREASVTVNAPPADNQLPTVRVTASPTGCHPKAWPTPDEPCTATCTVSASDPDGDALSYRWSGCATGSATTATCTVDDPGNHPCTVTVTDSKGGSTTASATVEGTNAPATMTNGCWVVCPSVPSVPPWQAFAGEYRFIGNDPDDEPWQSQYLTCSATSLTTGSCTVIQCYLYNSATGRFFVEFATRAAGTCTLRVTLTDDWAAPYSENVSIEVK